MHILDQKPAQLRMEPTSKFRSVEIDWWLPRAVSTGIKWPEREANHSPPSSAEYKNTCSYTSIPRMSSWHGA